jgi:hypothetical protein
MAREDACRGLITDRAIASSPREPPSQNQLPGTAALAGRVRGDFRAQGVEGIESHLQALAAAAQALQMQWQPARPTLEATDGLEQAIAVLQGSISAASS